MTMDQHRSMLIGPGFDPTEPEYRVTDEDLDAQAQAEPREADPDMVPVDPRLLRRLVVAFVLIVVSAALFWGVLPHYGVALPAYVPILAFVAILIGSIMSSIPERRLEQEETLNQLRNSSCGCAPDEDGVPIGCCQGPRPLQMFKKK